MLDSYAPTTSQPSITRARSVLPMSPHHAYQNPQEEEHYQQPLITRSISAVSPIIHHHSEQYYQHHHHHHHARDSLTHQRSLPTMTSPPLHQPYLQTARTAPPNYHPPTHYHPSSYQTPQPPVATYLDRGMTPTTPATPSYQPPLPPACALSGALTTYQPQQQPHPPPQYLNIPQSHQCASYSNLDTFSPQSITETAHFSATSYHFTQTYHASQQQQISAAANQASLDIWKPEGYGQAPSNLTENIASAAAIDYDAIPKPKIMMSRYHMTKLEQFPMREYTKWSEFRPTGRKKALLIGIHYSGVAELSGPINDVAFIRYLLRSKFGFEKENILILTDVLVEFPGYKIRRPTRQGILDGMRWLVEGAMEGDSLWCSFSGHGKQIDDMSNDEIDGLDEAILPEDYATAGYILDDEIHDILVRGTPVGARLTALFDACHCGSGLDLPCEYNADGSYVYTGRRVSSTSQLIQPPHSHSGDVDKASGVVHMTNPETSSCNQVGEVILFSGCKDDQMSAENHNGASMTGVMTYTLIKALESNDYRYMNYKQMMECMTRSMRTVKGCEQQTPQFSTSIPFSLNSTFCI